MKTVNHYSRAVPRGIQTVRADTDPLAGVIKELTGAFAEFKQENNDRSKALTSEIDQINVKLAAAEMGGAGAVTGRALSGDSPSQSGALRTKAQFAKYFASRADTSEPVSLSDFVRGVAGMKTTQAVNAALSIGTNTSGGFSVPAQTMPQILGALAPASSLIQAGAGIVPMDEGAKTQTTAAIETLPTAAWRNESAAVAESDPVFRAVVAQPRSLAFFFKISRELLADGSGINEGLETAIAAAFAKRLDETGLIGSGVAPVPTGLLNTANVIQIASGANGTALTNYSKLFEATQGILDADGPTPTAAIMSPRSLVKLGGLLDTTNQPLNVPPMLQSVSMIATSQIPNNLTVGTSTDCSVMFIGDFTRMYFLMREALSIQLLRESYAATGELAFLCHVRADVVVTYPKAFAVIRGVRA